MLAVLLPDCTQAAKEASTATEEMKPLGQLLCCHSQDLHLSSRIVCAGTIVKRERTHDAAATTGR